MEIGERIKYKRESLGMTQEELAIKAGYKSRSSINKIEKDGRGLPQSKILLIAQALETTPAYLMGWDDEDTELYSDEILQGINGMTSLLHYLYDDVDFHEYIVSETFDVTLKKDGHEVTLDENEYNLLFDFICSNIPNYINLIKGKTTTTNKPSSTETEPRKDTIQYYLNAAHARTDKISTPEDQAHDDAIMDDDKEWE